MKFKHLQEATSVPYTSKALDVYNNVTKDIPNPYDVYKLYRFKNGVYYITKTGSLHILTIEPCMSNYKKSIGLVDNTLKKTGMLSSDMYNCIWSKDINEFKKVFVNMNDAVKFANHVYDDIENIDVRDDNLGNIIEDIFEEYKR